MRNISTKVDNVDTLPADAFNSDQDELENAVLSADISLDPNAGPDTDLNMLGKTMAAYANAAGVYQDSGAADAYVLSIASNLKAVTKYYDNMMIVFKPGNTNTGASTVNVNTLGVKSLTLSDGTALSAGNVVANLFVFAIYSLSNDRFEITSAFSEPGLIQEVSSQDGTLATGTTQLPADNTIPQNTEGDQRLSVSITPKNAANRLVVEVVVVAACSGAGVIGAALFKDSAADAIAAVPERSTANEVVNLKFTHEIVAGGVVPIIFDVRVGCSVAGNTYFNGESAAQLYGGVAASSIRVREIKA